MVVECNDASNVDHELNGSIKFLNIILHRYQTTCELLQDGKRVESKESVDLRSGEFKDQIPKFVFVNIKCVEDHKFTAEWCCDVIPCAD
jgi:hypothetical protein